MFSDKKWWIEVEITIVSWKIIKYLEMKPIPKESMGQDKSQETLENVELNENIPKLVQCRQSSTNREIKKV